MAGLVCGHCGTVNPAGSRFCVSCDEFLDWESSQEAPETEPEWPAVRHQPLADPPPTAAPVPPTVAQPSPRQQPPPDLPPSLPLPAAPPRRAAPVSVAPPPERPVAVATTRHCPRCAVENPLQRRLCRHCGEWLVDPGVPVAPAPRPLRTRLRDRWWGGQRTAYRGSLSRTTIAFRTLSALAVLLVIALVLGVAGFNPVRRARDYVGHVRGSGRITDVQATAEPAGEIDGHPAAWATDDVRGRGWTTRWTAPDPGDLDGGCGATPTVPAVSHSLVLALGSPVNVREIGVEGGLAGDDPVRDGRWRPRTLELRWDGGCQTVHLEDTPDLQRFRVDQGEVAGVRITVVAGYEPTAAGQPGADRLDIGEITFWRR